VSKIAISGNASGTGTFTIAAPNSNTDRTLTLPDEAGTVLTSASDITAQAMNGPAFRVSRTTSTTLSSATNTTVPFNNDFSIYGTSFDTASCYDATNYRFVPNVAGYYFFHSQVQATDGNTGTFNLNLLKNGTRIASHQAETDSTTTYPTHRVAATLYMNGTTDYVEVQMRQTTGSNMTIYYQEWGFFEGYMVRGA